jgi:hypothetical protein
MTHSFLILFLLATLLQTDLRAQVITNYYNAPPISQPPGRTALPGNTPITPTATSGVSQGYYGGYGTNYYPQTYGTNYPQTYGGTNYYPQTYGTNYYPQPYGTQTTTGNVSTAFSTPLTTLGQQYPQPAQPTTYAQQPSQFVPIAIPVPAYAQVNPPDTWAPGLATIHNGKWMVTDFLYNLPPNISVKVLVIKPEGKYLPISDTLLENEINSIFQEANISTTVNPLPCEPPLPAFQVTIMAYPCERRCIGVITAQLYEIARPDRIADDLSGVWQVVTWERQELVASSCDDFKQQVEDTVGAMTATFTSQYRYYNAAPERSCFPEAAN